MSDQPQRLIQKIVKGHVDTSSDFNAVCKVIIYHSNGHKGVCTGTLIDKRWVVTAGHCFFKHLPFSEPYQVEVIFQKRMANGKMLNKTYQALELFQLDKFKYATGRKINDNNDIALIELGKELTSISPMQIPKIKKPTLKNPQPNNYSRFKGEAVIVGFGQTSAKSASSNVRRVADVNLNLATDRQFVSKYESNQGSGTCMGDSGGPLFKRGRTGQYQLIGITKSGNEECKRGNFQFVNILPMRDEIFKVILEDRGDIKERIRTVLAKAKLREESSKTPQNVLIASSVFLGFATLFSFMSKKG